MVADTTEVIATVKMSRGYAALVRQNGIMGLCLLHSLPDERIILSFSFDLVPVDIAKRLVELAELAEPADAG